MLENLFGSKTRAKLLNLFFKNTRGCYYIRQLARETKENVNSIRREIINLEKMGVIRQVLPDKMDLPLVEQDSEQEEKKKYYQANRDFILFEELRDLLVKSRLLVDRRALEKFKSIDDLKLLVLTGSFVNDDHVRTDLLAVGNMDKGKVKKMIESMEKNFDKPVRYTILTPKEFNTRNAMTDKFLFEIMEGRKIVVIDRMNG